MAKNIKTREVVKDIKVHETAGNTAAKVKDIGVKTKETVDDSKIKQDNPSAEQYAADKVTDEMRRVVETAAVTANSTVKKDVSKVKKQVKNKSAKKEETPDNPDPDDTENLSDEIENTPADDKADSSASEPKADTAESDKKYPNDKKRSDSGSFDSKQDDINPDAKNDNKNGQASKDKKSAKEKKESKPKTHSSESPDSSGNLQKPRQKEKFAPKTRDKQTVRIPRSAEKNIKTIDSAGKKIRQSYRSQKDAKKTIKTADRSAKTAEQTAKTAKKSAEVSVKAAKKAEEIAKATAKATAKAAKVTEQTTVTVDDDKLDIMRNIVSDMNAMTGKVTTKTAQDEKVKVLTVTITHLSADEASELYNFDAEQKAQLSELMSAYDSLWKELIGGSGDILSSNSNHIPKDIFAWPLQENGNITSYFGTRSDPFTGEITTHGGTDIAVPHGSPILAAADGTVVAATWNDSYGYYVKIQHNDTYSTLYAHCSALLVSAGQQVKQGQIIAQVGSTGNSTGVHLHFEVIQNGVRVDALDFFN